MAKPTLPMTTLKGRQNQLVSLAMDLVEKRIINGTATAQETVHFLKLGTTSFRTEEEIRERTRDLLKVKAEAIESQKRDDALFQEAIDAMRQYSGNAEFDRDYEDEY